jgi:putative ABC transport system substrate-binding protein
MKHSVFNVKPCCPTTCAAKHVAWVVLLLSLFIIIPASVANPLQRHGPTAIGMLAYLWAPTEDMLGLREGLQTLGYHQDVHVALGVRFAAGNDQQLEPIIRQFLNYGAQILYVSEWNVLQAARRVTTHMPIVFSSWYPPPRDGTLTRLSDLGDNVTGVIPAFPDVDPRVLEKFRLLIPSLNRVLVPYEANAPYLVEQLTALRVAAQHLNIKLIEHAVHTQEEAKQVILTTPKEAMDGILPVGGGLNISGYTLQTSLQRHIPTLFSRDWMAEYGGLASYGPSWYALGQQAAHLVDKIIQGAHPKTLPVEVSQAAQFVINLRTAKQLGITIPPDLLSQADTVIR